MNFRQGSFAIIFISLAGWIHAAQPDSLETAPVDSLFLTVQDSLPADSSASADTTAAKEKADLEGPIYYWGDSVKVSRSDNIIYLQGNAKIKYQNMTLEAALITIDQDDHFLYAKGIIDTVDSLGNPIYKGIPIFTETGEEPIYGDSVYFDFKTKRGRVSHGKTQMPPGYYKGIAIHKISNKTYLIKDGYFTSCEYIDDPHFYFRSEKMRMVANDKIVARPVYLYIADVPLLAIPFGVFPNKRGRRSGLVVPTYGENDYGGRYLRDIGYYWAPNDYFDALLTTDFYDKIGFTYAARVNYKLRYVLDGNFDGYYLPRDPNSGLENHRWAVSLNHSQIIDPTMRFSASGRFQSDKTLAQDLSPDVEVRTNQNLYSSFNLSKSWPGTRNSLSLSASRNENLQNGNWSYTLPNLRFTRQQSELWETLTGQKSRGKKQWYQNIMFSYNSDLLHRGSKTLQTSDSTFKYDTEQGMQHSFGFNAPLKVLKYFNLSPNLNFREVWVNEIYLPQTDPESGLAEKNKVQQFAARHTFDTGASMRTTLYGLFEPKIGGLKSIRHKIDPSISYTFTPDFSDPSYGYVTSYTDTLGNIQKVDKFATSPYGGTPAAKSQRMGISVNNLFQAKVGEGDQERKIDLFTVNFSTSHDFNRDSLKWSDLAANFRATPIKGVNLNMSTSHSFYDLVNNRPVNKFLPAEGKLPLLLRFTAGLSFGLSSGMFSSKDDQEEKETEEEITDKTFMDETSMNRSMIQQEKLSDRYAAKNLEIPWDISFNVNYRYTRGSAAKSFDVNPQARISLTKNWRISWSTRIDLAEQEITYQSFSIYRDLHCWEMSLSWQPTYGYYQFRINVKTSVLKDLKLEKKPTSRTYY